jgi:hypothetical protein
MALLTHSVILPSLVHALPRGPSLITKVDIEGKKPAVAEKADFYSAFGVNIYEEQKHIEALLRDRVKVEDSSAGSSINNLFSNNDEQNAEGKEQLFLKKKTAHL